jgi:anti-sigma-K factor RskA
VISHEQASELLGAYALDAIGGDELADMEEHLASCPRCQSELDTLRRVPEAMSGSVEPLPQGLWENIVSRFPEGLQAAEPASRSPFRTPSSARTWRTRSVVMLLGAVALAAVAVAAVFGIDLVRTQDNVSRLQADVSRLHADYSALQAKENDTPVAVALQTPGHSMVTLESSSGEQLATFVIVPGGHGYLVSSQLPALSRGRTYQLWGIFGGSPISLGLLGASPRDATFTIAGAPWAAKLAVTAEPVGGTVAPTGSIVASGTV